MIINQTVDKVITLAAIMKPRKHFTLRWYPDRLMLPLVHGNRTFVLRQFVTAFESPPPRTCYNRCRVVLQSFTAFKHVPGKKIRRTNSYRAILTIKQCLMLHYVFDCCFGLYNC